MGWYCPRCGIDGTAPPFGGAAGRTQVPAVDAHGGGACPRDGTLLAETSVHELVGRMVGDYRIVGRLGGGSFGQVYRAVHPRSGLVVAIKLLERAIESTESQRVLTEARAAASLRHRNVVQVYDLAMTSDHRPYIVMELLEGATLRERWTTTVPAGELARIASEILRGLAAAHRLGIVHRDLKPDNVFVTTRGRVVIVDFGLAKLLADPRSPHLTVTGESLGTPRYISPEQIRCKPIDGRSDLYALGVMMYEALAGKPPFEDDATFALFDAHLHRPPPPLRGRLAAVIERALAKAPDARFPDADTMRRALAPRVSRRRWPYAVAGVMVAAITIAVVASREVAAPSPPPPPPQPAAAGGYEQDGLATLRANLDRHAYTRAQVVQMLCPVDKAVRALDRSGGPDAGHLAYLRELHALLAAYVPDLDRKTECPR